MSPRPRRRVTAGVAIACVGIIVATPVAPPPPNDFHTGAVQLAAAEGFGDVMGDLAAQVAADPAPDDPTDFFDTLATLVTTIYYNLEGYAIGIIPVLISEFVNSEDTLQTLQNVFYDLFVLPVLLVGAPIWSALTGDSDITIESPLPDSPDGTLPELPDLGDAGVAADAGPLAHDLTPDFSGMFLDAAAF
jgi:hypothetical protein